MKLEDIILRNTRANQPLATAVPVGTLYFVTDESVLERSSGTAWEAYGGGGSTDAAALTGILPDTVFPAVLPAVSGENLTNLPAGSAGAPDFVTKRVWAISVNTTGSGSTAAGVGCTAATVGPVQTNVNDATGPWTRSSPNAAGTYGGIQSGNGNLFKTIIDPTITVQFRTGSDITSVRIFIGIGAFVPSSNADDPGSNDCAFFRYSAATDSGWVGVTKDASTLSATAQVAAIAASTVYNLKIRFSGGGTEVHFSVNGGAEVTKTVNLPRTTAIMGLYLVGCPTVAATRNFDYTTIQAVSGV